MDKLLFNLVLVAAVAAVCSATQPPVKQCPELDFDDLENRIQIDPCGSKKCKLPREVNVTVAFKFKPMHRVAKLKNSVYASIGILKLPFIGTTETSACGDVRFADTKKPAPCPLEPGIEYVYSNVFYIYPIYPITNLVVHWSLDDEDNGKKVICFEVPAAIVDAKKKQ